MKTFQSIYFYFLPAIMLIAIGIQGCTKGINAINNSMTNSQDRTITDTSIYIDITLDNNRILRIENANNPSTWGIVWGAGPNDSTVFPYNRVVSDFVENSSEFSPGFQFAKGNLGFHTIGTLPLNFTDSFFSPGNYVYSVKTVDTSYNYLGTPTDTVTLFDRIYTRTLLSSGISVAWEDSLGTTWETFNGSADQSGSRFTITEVKPITNGNTTDKPIGAIISATFDCLLYDNKGNSKHLTNGSFRLEAYY
jgi:hypothetical protein